MGPSGGIASPVRYADYKRRHFKKEIDQFPYGMRPGPAAADWELSWGKDSSVRVLNDYKLLKGETYEHPLWKIQFYHFYLD